ncbi:MAG: pilin [Minisyncoccota bacterium]
MKKLLYATLAFAPMVAGAQSLNNIDTLLENIGDLVSAALPIVVGLALLGFFWGLMKFIFSAGDEDAKEKGKQIMIYGIVALFVMVAVWGLVEFIAESLGVDTDGEAVVPGVEGL